jgi:hypothetical protein
MNKTLIALAAAGFAVSGAGMLSAQAAPVHGAAASSHQQGKASCARTVGSTTNLALDKHTMRAGGANLITVHVHSTAGPAHPDGSVEVAIYQSQSGTGVSGDLKNGVMTHHFPRDMSAGKYDVRATYIPGTCSKWKRSMSSVEHLTVN